MGAVRLAADGRADGRGVDVTLFATADSLTAARLSATAARGWSEDPTVDPKVAECLHIAAVFERAGEFDLIHNSFDFLPLTYSALVSTPVLTTIHGFSSPAIVPVYERYNRHGAYVAISDADRHPRLDYLCTIHHGIDTDAFPLQASPGGYLLFFGRIHPAQGTGAGDRGGPAGRASPGDGRDRAGPALLRRGGGAPHRRPTWSASSGRWGPPSVRRSSAAPLALLHLIGFDEPFGFSVVEAMACGTPVVAFRRGSMPELVDDGRTGFLVDDVDGAVDALRRVEALDRAAIRRTAVDRFGRDRMVDEYLGGLRQGARRVLTDPRLFRLGVNYWPAEKAMDWLADYDPPVTRRDFLRARAAGFDSVRVFVRWADIQPDAATHRPGRRSDISSTRPTPPSRPAWNSSSRSSSGT